MIHRNNTVHIAVGLTVGTAAWSPPQQQDNVNGEPQHLAGPPAFFQLLCSPGQVPQILILSTCANFNCPIVSHPKM